MTEVSDEYKMERLMAEFGQYAKSITQMSDCLHVQLVMPWHGYAPKTYHSMYSNEPIRPVWKAEPHPDSERIAEEILRQRTEELLKQFGCFTHSALPMASTKGAEPRRTSHVPEQVIYNGTTTIAVFPDGKKVKSRPDKGATFDKETGLAMCIVKHVYGTRAKFLKAIEKANDQNKEKE